MFEKIKQIDKAYIYIFIIVVILHLATHPQLSDDSFFSGIGMNGILNFCQERYITWTSRVIIEGILILFVNLPHYLFCLVNSLMIMLLIYSLNMLLKIRDRNLIFLFSALMALLPFSLLSDAGWYATSINYLWPIALGTYSFLQLRRSREDSRISSWKVFLIILCTLFASNNEQICIVLLIALVYELMMTIHQRKKISTALVFTFAITIIMLLFTLTCPGNQNRLVTETGNWYPAFDTFNFVDKCILAVLSTFNALFLPCYTYKRYLFLLFAIGLLLLTIYNKKKLIDILISAIPLLMIIIGWLCYKEVLSIPQLNAIFVAKYTVDTYHSTSCIECLILSTIVIISILYTLVHNYGVTGFQYSLVFLIGFASRAMLGFSPTVYASGLRTSMVLMLSLAILIYFIMKSFRSNTKMYRFMVLLVVAANFLVLYSSMSVMNHTFFVSLLS